MASGIALEKLLMRGRVSVRRPGTQRWRPGIAKALSFRSITFCCFFPTAATGAIGADGTLLRAPGPSQRKKVRWNPSMSVWCEAVGTQNRNS